ncbi:MAG: HIT-like protein HinT [Lentisphaerae bacterium ADurb.BinA184]|nr:MAG: HIT-like protein HinT [Lentisphaerae bacterium ADurb.BinA184]
MVAGGIPCVKVFEDGHCLAFLDIGPLAPGHVLLIPKVHAETLDQMSAETAAAVLRHLPALVRAVREATGCEGVNILQNNGRVAHQAVPHVHVHIIPRKTGDAWQFNWPAGRYCPGEMEALAGRIRARLPAG